MIEEKGAIRIIAGLDPQIDQGSPLRTVRRVRRPRPTTLRLNQFFHTSLAKIQLGR